jgi:hypothetical protein
MTGVVDLDQLLEDAPDDPEAARELADLVRAALAQPDRRVGAAFGFRHHGGEPEWRRSARGRRDGALREIARRQFGDAALTKPQARTLRIRLQRQLASTRPSGADVDLLRQIDETGLSMPGLKQFLRIINGF